MRKMKDKNDKFTQLGDGDRGAKEPGQNAGVDGVTDHRIGPGGDQLVALLNRQVARAEGTASAAGCELSRAGRSRRNVVESIDSRGGRKCGAKAGTLGSTSRTNFSRSQTGSRLFLRRRQRPRSGSIVFDLDSSETPAVAEPWFLAFNAQVSFRPIMNPQDLAKAGPSISKAAGQYGK